MLMLALMLMGSVATIATLATTHEVEASSKKISLNKKSITLAVGRSYTLKTRNTNRKATWKTSKKSVASISNKKSKSVKINAKKTGTTVINARIGGKNYKCTVKVVNPKISKTSLNIRKGNTTTLKVTGGTGTIKWSTSDKSIATVNKNGKITAKKGGTAKITATRNSKKLTASVKVLVQKKRLVSPGVPAKEAVYRTEIQDICHTCGANLTGGKAGQHLDDTSHAGYGEKAVQVLVSPAVPAVPAVYETYWA